MILVKVPGISRNDTRNDVLQQIVSNIILVFLSRMNGKSG